MRFLSWSLFLIPVALVKPVSAEVVELRQTVRCRYTGLDFHGIQFLGMDELEKLELLMALVNQDPDIARLNVIEFIGSIIAVSQWQDTPSAGWGINVCIGLNGLYVYDWNDLTGKHDDIPLSLDSLKNLNISLDCEGLRRAIINEVS